MQTPTLAASGRTKMKKAAKHLLTAGRIPAVLYGHGAENRAVEVERVPFAKVYRAAGESTLVDLAVDGGAPVKVLIHDTQRDPLRGDVVHIDFLQVNMKEKLTTDIRLAFTGEAPAARGLGGTLIRNLDHVTVECLPGDLVHEIPVDLGVLKAFDDAIRVKDLVPPPGIAIMEEPEEVLAYVEAPRSEEELKALEGKVEASVESVEVVAKKKKEGEEAAAEEEKPAGKTEKA